METLGPCSGGVAILGWPSAHPAAWPRRGHAAHPTSSLPNGHVGWDPQTKGKRNLGRSPVWFGGLFLFPVHA